MDILLLTDDRIVVKEHALDVKEKVFLITGNRKLLEFATKVYQFFYVDTHDDIHVSEIISYVQKENTINTIIKF